MTKKELEKYWNNMEEWFDWEKVERAMLLLNWRWGMAELPPTVKELKETAKRLIMGLEGHKSCSTGGFKAIKHKDSVDLLFSVSSWTSHECNLDSKERKPK